MVAEVRIVGNNIERERKAWSEHRRHQVFDKELNLNEKYLYMILEGT